MLYNPLQRLSTDKRWFRIYDRKHRMRTDYRLRADEIDVRILSTGLSLYERDDGKNRLDWASHVLSHPMREMVKDAERDLRFMKSVKEKSSLPE